jgi:hypothetical protein
MQKLLVITLTAALLVPGAVLADSGALTAGKPAGIRAAQGANTSLIVGAIGVGILITGVVFASDCCKSSNAKVPLTVSPTTTGGSTA